MKYTNIITEANEDSILVDVEEKWYNSKDKTKKALADEAGAIMDWFYAQKVTDEIRAEYLTKRNEFSKKITKLKLYKNGQILEDLNESEILESKTSQTDFKYKSYMIVRNQGSMTQGTYSIHKNGVELLSFDLTRNGDDDGRKNIFFKTDDELKKEVDMILKNPLFKKQLSVDVKSSEPEYVLKQKYSCPSGMGGSITYQLISIKGDKLIFKNVMHKDYGGGKKITLTKNEANKKFFNFVK